jgi:hypothetical protein
MGSNHILQGDPVCMPVTLQYYLRNYLFQVRQTVIDSLCTKYKNGNQLLLKVRRLGYFAHGVCLQQNTLSSRDNTKDTIFGGVPYAMSECILILHPRGLHYTEFSIC